MHRAWRFSIQLAAALLALAAGAAEPQEVQPTSRPAIVKPKSWVGIVPPDPISRETLDRYGKMLELSDEQQQIYARLRDDYERFCVMYITDTMQPMWTRAGEANKGDGAAKFQAYDALHEDRAKATKELRSRETTMFDALAEVLAAPQRLNLSIVVLDRQRQLLESRSFIIAEATPDLVKLLLELKIPFDAENAPLKQCVSDYIVAIVPALKAADDATSRMARKDHEILAEYVELQKRQEEGWHVRGQALLEQRADEHKKCLNEYKAIRDINRRFLALIIPTLPDADRARLRDAFREASYHAPLYPDRQSVDGAIAEARAIDTLTEIQRGAIDALAQQYSDSYEALARRIHDSIDDWRILAFTEPSVHNDVRAQYEKKTEDLTADRLEMNKQHYKRLIELLTPEQAATITPLPKPIEPRPMPR